MTKQNEPEIDQSRHHFTEDVSSDQIMLRLKKSQGFGGGTEPCSLI